MTKKDRPAPSKAFPIVGIGASAGGLQAVSHLLKALPLDTGMAFVVVQHLDPTHKSLLPEILQKSTGMPVSQVKPDVLVVPNHVYVIPPNRHMCITSGRLRLRPRPAGIHALAVNCFLTSLAEERGNHAIAVILSGTASDGSLGIKAIKAEGGLVFAQDQATAGHFGMPQSAEATGAVDFVLPPGRIASELIRLAHQSIAKPAEDPFDDSERLREAFKLVQRATGVDFSLYKPSTVRRRLVRRMMIHRMRGLETYLPLLQKDQDEVRALHDDLLIHVTQFFREPKVFAALRAKVLPRIIKSLAPDQAIRVWVPGCSSGEEPYSLAIAILDFLSEREGNNPVQIFATDISDASLEKARAGVYPEDVPEYVPARLLRRFFHKVPGGYEVIKRVRDICVFAKQDLTRDPPFGNVDLISCCNVLIYLSPAAQARVMPKLHYALRPSGALILSKSESVGEFEDLFQPADKTCHLYYRRPSLLRPRLETPLKTEDPAPRPKKVAPIPALGPQTDIHKVAERILLNRYAPAAVVVDGDLGVLHYQGPVSRYLEPASGKASLNLAKMLPPHSVDLVRQTLQRAKKSEAPARKSGAEWRDGRGTLELIPFRLPVSGERFYIVVFDDERPESPRRPSPAKAGPEDAAQTRRLKSELMSTRSYLQTVTKEHEAAGEELKSANEEITSANEELQSTNEELEIAKEELQASNEELTTLNEELQTRNEGLSTLNNDLVNLIASVHIPIVMVSGDMRIRRFSPTAERVMNLIPSDVGRPIGDLKPKLSLPNIESIVQGVIETVMPQEVEVFDPEGHSYAVRIRPYRTADNKIDGAVIVWVDNDPIKRNLLQLDDASAFEAVLDVGPPLAVLDSNLRIKAGSRSLYQAFGLTPDALGSSLFEVEGGRWNVPDLREALERLAASGAPFRDLPAKIGGKTVRFSARRTAGGGKTPPAILLSLS